MLAAGGVVNIVQARYAQPQNLLDGKSACFSEQQTPKHLEDSKPHALNSQKP